MIDKQTSTVVATETATLATNQDVPCAHCGLPSPPPETSQQLAFCCGGCRGAYQLIHGWGLDDYYALRHRLTGTTSFEAVSVGDDEELLDDFEVLGLSAPKATAEGLLRSRLAVAGLHCGACAWLIERAANLVPGWHSARVRMQDHTVDILFDPSQVRLSEIGRLLRSLGYHVFPLLDDAANSASLIDNRRLLAQIAIAGFCAANAMWIAVALYAGAFSWIAASHATMLRIFGSVLGLIAVVGPGQTFFRGALAAIRTRTPHMDLPVALGIGIGALSGLINALLNVGETYFDSVATLVFLLLVGRWLQVRQQRRAADSVRLLMRLAPQHAWLVSPNGPLRRVRVDRLKQGDQVEIAAGEGVPCDGDIVTGQSLLNRSLMTGEPHPVEVGPGDTIEAGTENLQSPLRIRVTAIGTDSRAGRLMQMVEEESLAKSPSVQWADQIGGIFVVLVLAAAMVTLITWSLLEGFQVAATYTIALLIVACPCALALATPLAIAVGLGRAAQRRILVRGGDVLERIARPGIVWFDKTGTLTEGQMEVSEGGQQLDEHILRLAAAVESGSQHPVAHAIMDLAQRRGIAVPQGCQMEQQIGGGVMGSVEGERVTIGTLAFLAQQQVDISASLQTRFAEIANRGATPIALAVNGRPVGLLGVSDPLRKDAAEVVERLQTTGWEVGILSGDHPSTVKRFADRLGISSQWATGNLSPEQKTAMLHRSRTDGKTVMMVGDGVNDAVALAAADVGVAIRGGAEASLAAAPVYLADGRLSRLVELIEAGGRTVKVIRRNLKISLGYNLLAVGLAITGAIHPLMAAVLMPLSSLSVLSMTIASPTFSNRSHNDQDST